MTQNRKTVKLAKAILAHLTHERKAILSCGQCNGTGTYVEESGHNGSEFNANCDCWMRDAPPKPNLIWCDDELKRMAERYLGMS